ncbi:amidase [Caballeronia sp. LZ001]|uniref:amidase n=1 Tax=Caballeronia sp. LZ001 TaxID=3038553 RepID=UPI002863BB78|nr:amidase [Caballeronia sp. LZ001]MDR5804768.1 amidase [Caballeronia sp. LZ001]
MSHEQITSMTLTQVADALQRRDIKSSEVLDACLSLQQRVGASLNAFAWVDTEHAWEAARRCDAIAEKRTPLGRLHGVPLAHKDIFAQRGRPCAFGSALYSSQRFAFDATAISLLSQQGAYSFAGLNMAEFAQNGTGHNSHTGDVHNAWGARYISGGSSSGSGAAVASNLTFASLGTDTGGSIRLPASANGVTGIKPTQTRVSRHGVMPLSFSMDNVGPLARSARDCALMLSVIAGVDEADKSSSNMPVSDYEAMLSGDVRGLKIGVPRSFFFDGASAAILAASEDFIAVLKSRGASVRAVDVPLMDAIHTYGSLVIRSEGASVHAENMRLSAGAMTAHTNAKLFANLAIPATYYIEALRRRGPILKTFSREVFSKVDVLVAPTVKFELPTREESDVELNGNDAGQFAANISDNTRPFNYLGLPAVSVPCGFDSRGLPVGMQIVGRPFSEGTILNAAHAFQLTTEWHLKSPLADSFCKNPSVALATNS